MARKVKSQRLPSGLYAYKGKARPFSKLPKSEQSAWRSLRATRAIKAEAAIRAKLAAETVRRPPIKEDAWQQKRGATVFESTVNPFERIEDVTKRVGDSAREGFNGKSGQWIAVIEWPKDERSEPGKPYETIVGERPTDIRGKTDGRKELIETLKSIERTQGQVLKAGGKSKGRGPPVVKEIRFVVFPEHMKKDRKGKRHVPIPED